MAENIEQAVKKIIAEQLGVNEAEIKNEDSFLISASLTPSAPTRSTPSSS